MVSWAVELGEFDIQVQPRPAIKSWVLTDFIVEFTTPATKSTLVDETEAPTEQAAHGNNRDGPRPPEDDNEIHWILHVDGSASKGGCEARVVLQGPDEFIAEYALRLDFKASNNEDEYEALLAGLSLAAELDAKKLKVYIDSQLVVEQVNGTYEAMELRMKRYLQKVREKLGGMGEIEVLQVPRGMNDRVDALSGMASEETHDFGSVYTEILLHPSIDEKQVLEILASPNWMDPIVRYLKDGILREDKLEAWRLIAKATHYMLHGSKLYKRLYTWPYLRCLVPFESEYALREVHEGICRDHGAERTLAQKIIRHGYFWPTILRDTQEFVRKSGPSPPAVHPLYLSNRPAALRHVGHGPGLPILKCPRRAYNAIRRH
ncbi:uncharacterized protein LOC143856053 [Tasmannia lanceolata]|uniref:uncharacterized protein LOC143856053 n=1 Tax=Tasmannia lanceolata TaxID=3420 RepID=UPI0040647E53